MIEDAEVFARRVVLLERRDAGQRLAVMDVAGGPERVIDLPEPMYEVAPVHNAEPDPPAFRFSYSSPITPPTTYDYDFAAGTLAVRKRLAVGGGFDSSKYRTERTWATASDGVRVPISLVYRGELVKDGKRPLLLTGYGAYGIPFDTPFDSEAVSLLDRGVVVAMAHIRGGGDLGKRWHDDGRMMHKMNTFTDFIACADHLVAGGYTARDRIAIRGGSAGGLLIGAVLNLRPDVARAAVAQVPFVDVINTMLDPTLPLTVPEFEEWGDPRKPDQYAYIRRYSPYDNVAKAAYPALLVVTGYHDSQVGYWEPVKWVARLRATQTGTLPLLLRVFMGSGHSGASGRYDSLREEAFVQAFLLGQLGATARSG
jgi:oligopeptidase B